jgi:molecular chaperone GrpE
MQEQKFETQSETDKKPELNREDAEQGSENEEVSEELTNNENSDIETELASLKDSLLREKAEFANYRKRTAAEKVQISKYATGSLLEKLLPALDSMEQLLSSKDAAANQGNLEQFYQGAELIQKQLLQSFQDEGLELLNPVGEEFDPAIMEALGMGESPEVTVETVNQVYQKGYKIDQKIIRPARVFVQKPVSTEEPSEYNEETENSN